MGWKVILSTVHNSQPKKERRKYKLYCNAMLSAFFVIFNKNGHMWINLGIIFFIIYFKLKLDVSINANQFRNTFDLVQLSENCIGRRKNF